MSHILLLFYDMKGGKVLLITYRFNYPKRERCTVLSFNDKGVLYWLIVFYIE